jgi:hypothetical protein
LASPVDIDQKLRIADICPHDNTAQFLDLLEDDAQALLEEEALLQELRDAAAADNTARCAHVWPDRLKAGAQCLNCRLVYESWTIWPPTSQAGHSLDEQH